MQLNLDTDDKPHVVVLGAGLAGLSVALAALKARPCHVTILEKEAKPGGDGDFTEDRKSQIRSGTAPHL